MKQLILLALVAIHFSLSASDRGRAVIIPYDLESSVFDAELSQYDALFTFNLKGILHPKGSHRFLYSIDGVNHAITLDEELTFTVRTRPGKHSFKFFYNSNYFEIETGELTIKPRYHDTYCFFKMR